MLPGSWMAKVENWKGLSSAVYLLCKMPIFTNTEHEKLQKPLFCSLLLETYLRSFHLQNEREKIVGNGKLNLNLIRKPLPNRMCILTQKKILKRDWSLLITDANREGSSQHYDIMFKEVFTLQPYFYYLTTPK